MTTKRPLSVPPVPASPLPPIAAWILSVVVLALVSGLAVYEAGGTVTAAILAALLALPVGAGGAAIYQRRRHRRGGPPASLVTLLASLGAGAAMVAFVSCASGCGAGAQQRVVSSVALAAVAVDREAAEVYDRRAREEIERQAADGGTLSTWCEAIRPTWEIVSRVECGAVALADAAIAGQRLIDAAGGEVDGPAWIAWVAPVGAVVGAVVAGWEAVDPGGPPAELRQACGLVEALAGGSDLAPVCDVPPVPGCEEVSP